MKFERNEKILPFKNSTPSRLVDIDLEAQVIGAVLSDNILWKDINFLEKEAFNDPIHSELWEMISQQILNGKSASPSALTASFGQRIDAIGGRDILSWLVNIGNQIGPALQDASERLHNLSKWRRIHAIQNNLKEQVEKQETDPDTVLSMLIKDTEKAISEGETTLRSKKEIAKSAIEEAKIKRTSITTGITSLDFLLHGGLAPKRLYGIGGSFGRGKTIMLGTISDNINLQNEKHLFISMETPPEDIEIRNCARRLKLNAGQVYDQDHPLHQKFLDNADRWLNVMPNNTLYEYMPAGSIDKIHRTIIQACHKHGIKGFILDYWQLIRGKPKGVSEDAHLREVANRLAEICRRENIWGIVTAQTDEHGRLRYSDGLYMAAALFVQMVREENDDTAYFVTAKSNYTRYADTGNESSPNMIFDMQGPHFRDTNPEEMSSLNHENDEIKFD